MVSVFHRYDPRLQDAIASKLGWKALRPVQEAAGEALFRGDDALILAPTAGGKTEAAFFPLLSLLASESTLEGRAEVAAPKGPTSGGVSLLYIAPLRALLNHQGERIQSYGETLGLRTFVWHGDVGHSRKRSFLREPADVLMTTPESLEVLLSSSRAESVALFDVLRAVIVDEIHAFAGRDRGAHLMSVLERVVRLSRLKVQRVGLSATVGNPERLLKWMQGSSTRAGSVIAPEGEPKRRQLLITYRKRGLGLYPLCVESARGIKSLYFCESRHVAESLAAALGRAVANVYVHHSAVSRRERERAEQLFRGAGDACIVCTSSLELGMDIGDLDRVFQSEAPTTVSSFLQRMGRSGRREGGVESFRFFCSMRESVVVAIALIELAKEGYIESITIPQRVWTAFIHQLLMFSLKDGGFTPEAAWTHLSRIEDFQGITREEFERLLAWMIKRGALREAAGRVVVGPATEARFGRKNFMELFAVFTTPDHYIVREDGGRELGTLDRFFAVRLREGESSFVLAGRAWTVIEVDRWKSTVTVVRTKEAENAIWGDSAPRFISLEIARRIRAVLESDEHYPYVDAQTFEALQSMRAGYRAASPMPWGRAEYAVENVHWWNFAGGRINATLALALREFFPNGSVTAGNLSVSVRDDSLVPARFEAALEALSEARVWSDPERQERLIASLPTSELSKFQWFMPPWIEREYIASLVLDLEGTERWMRECTKGDAFALNN